MSSKNEITKKKCVSNLNADEKNLKQNYDQTECSEEDDVNFYTQTERNYENRSDNEERQECNEDYSKSCDTIDYYEERSNDGNED